MEVGVRGVGRGCRLCAVRGGVRLGSDRLNRRLLWSGSRRVPEGMVRSGVHTLTETGYYCFALGMLVRTARPPSHLPK